MTMEKELDPKGKPYSYGHYMMYMAVTSLLAQKPAKVLEVGCGRGYGLELLLKHNCIERYHGVEQIESEIAEAHKLVQAQQAEKFALLSHGDWFDIQDQHQYDVGVLIEVIEHVKKEDWIPFLRKMRNNIRKCLFMSTPNVLNQEHGTGRPEEFCQVLKWAEFDHVAYIEHQWTTFYIATINHEKIK